VKNYLRGVECLSNDHGRTLEFPDVYMILEGYSARVAREWYTHVGGLPTRLQASTRYIDYQHGFEYITPKSISDNRDAFIVYAKTMSEIKKGLQELDRLGIPREDSALCLPLGMGTIVVCKHNLRNLIDMSHQRMCKRAYHEYRKLFHDLCNALREYSDEWAYLVDNYFMPKCKVVGFCKEKYTCGMMPRKESK
jgi:thymidylate synthase (FAD)